jgi:tetratricopeptide (TPR) repeat protein
MSKPSPTFDIFLSYSRKDNRPMQPSDATGWVTALHKEILLDHRRFSTESLNIFFDTSAIRDMDDWRHRILEGLRHSRILLVCLSPEYFRSEYCRWEFDEYVKRQVHQLMGHDSFAQVYFVEVPSASEHATSQGWRELLCRTNYTDLRPWFPQGLTALREEVVRQKIASLGTSLWKRIKRARRATSVSGNLRRPNPHFIGRVTEMRQLHEKLALGAVGIVTVINGMGGQGKTELAIAYAHGWADSYPGGLWVLAAEGKKEILPLLGELVDELGIPRSISFEEKVEQRGRRVLAELKRRALDARNRDPDQGAACLLLLDNVSEAFLLAEPQLSQLPREDWLRIVVTTREGPDKFHASPKESLTFVAVDGLGVEDAERLIESHQSDARWPIQTAAADQAATRDIVRALGGFTLAVESVAIYLGLHPDIRPADYLARLHSEGLSRFDDLALNADVGAQIQHREKQLRVVLMQTVAELSQVERNALEYAAFLHSDGIPWPCLRHLVATGQPNGLQSRPGYPDPWFTLRRRLEGLRLLTPGDHPEIARMHPLVAACLRELVQNAAAKNPLLDLAEFVSVIDTPFSYDVPLDIFLNTWNSMAHAWSLRSRLTENAAANKSLCTAFAERWTELSFQLGDASLEEWWLHQWEEDSKPNNRLIAKKAAFLHRNGNTNDACMILKQTIRSRGQDFDLSSQLLMYLAQLGLHEEANTLAQSIEAENTSILSCNKLLSARLYHRKYFILHEMEKNGEATSANRFIREVYSENHLTYDSLIASVNLGDALWGIGEISEAEEILRLALAKGRAFGLLHVEDIAAICLANVLSSIGATNEASELYTLGVGLSKRIGHLWDAIYARSYQELHDFEAGRVSTDGFQAIRKTAVDAGFKFLASLIDSHICIASFVRIIDEGHLREAIRRGLESPFSGCRLYALSAALQNDLASGRAFDRSCVLEWVKSLELVQGLKGRIGVIALVADWLIDTGTINVDHAKKVREWVARYVPPTLADFYNQRYPFRNRRVM